MVDLFHNQPATLSDMLGCARRELAMRRRVYPRQVALGKMKDEEAERETAIMAAIAAHFEELATHRDG